MKYKLYYQDGTVKNVSVDGNNKKTVIEKIKEINIYNFETEKPQVKQVKFDERNCYLFIDYYNTGLLE